MSRRWTKDIAGEFFVPDYIVACAEAVASDLLYGPKQALIPAEGIEHFNGDTYGWGDDIEGDKGEGDTITAVYTGAVGQALRDYIDSLPSNLYWDRESGCVMTSEPDGEWVNEDYEPCDEGDEGARWIDPPIYYEIERSDIVEALFGITIAREFH